jgi:hypothetical protein
LSPYLSSILKRANQLFLFGIDTDDRPSKLPKGSPMDLNVLKLLISIRMIVGRQAFDVTFGMDVILMQQAANGLTTQLVPLFFQGCLQAAQTALDPASAVFRIASHFVLNQLKQSCLYFGRFFFHRWPTGARQAYTVNGAVFQIILQLIKSAPNGLFVQPSDLGDQLDPAVSIPTCLQRCIPPPLLFIETTHQQVDLMVNDSIRMIGLTLANLTLTLMDFY